MVYTRERGKLGGKQEENKPTNIQAVAASVTPKVRKERTLPTGQSCLHSF